jgi:hypothetical protein
MRHQKGGKEAGADPSGLVAQSEIADLVDMLYGSYGERLIGSYKKAS